MEVGVGDDGVEERGTIQVGAGKVDAVSHAVRQVHVPKVCKVQHGKANLCKANVANKSCQFRISQDSALGTLLLEVLGMHFMPC